MTNPLAEGQQSRLMEPCSLVIFGATGDLTARKIVPALYNLLKDGQLPSLFTCIGFARRPKSNDEFRAEMKEAVGKYSRTKPIEDSIWNHFQDHLFYHQSEFHEDEGYEKLKTLLQQFDIKYGTKGNRIFYLATQPVSFPVICEKLHKAGLIYDEKKVKDQKWSRMIIEKPFGHDLASAHELQDELLKYLSEKQIYRIDHYLGKETVQNLLAFRFSNSIFESLWNNNHIDHVQITVAEDIGIGTRGKFFENAGLLRDMIQNHTMQLLSLVAMEPPLSLEADAIRDQKVKALESIRPLKIDDVIRGQYGPGLVNGTEVVGYRQEPDVNPHSNIETYLALKLFIDNPRWSGVPFYLRAGKRLPKKTTEIAVIFKDACGASGALFQNGNRKNPPNVLVIRIQPDEGSSIKINCKVPGPTNTLQPVKMDFRYGSYFGTTPPEAYERLICDCIVGDSTLFAREDEVFNSWKLLTPLLDNWAKNPPKDFPNYPAGSWGPKAADQLIEADGRKWRLI